MNEHGVVETLTGLLQTGDIIIQATLESSLRKTSDVGSNGVTIDFPKLPIIKMDTNSQDDSYLSPLVILCRHRCPYLRLLHQKLQVRLIQRHSLLGGSYIKSSQYFIYFALRTLFFVFGGVRSFGKVCIFTLMFILS